MYSELLRQKLLESALVYAAAPASIKGYNTGLEKAPETALIFDKKEDNFHPDSWGKIVADPKYHNRTLKAHSSFDPMHNVAEMQSNTSSDALLMSIFCHPSINSWKGVKQLLAVTDLSNLIFGYQPGVLLKNNQMDRTEIDLFIETSSKRIFCESKLTETDFVFESLEKFERYENFSAVFDIDNLPHFQGFVANYQLVRNILAAYQFDGYFYLFIDARRPDLAKSFYQTLRCVKPTELRMRCEIFYWQDIAATLGADLQTFLKNKYGINS